MCTCLEQELDDTARWWLANNKRCHHVLHRRRGHPNIPGFPEKEPNNEDGPLARDAAERADENDQKSEEYSHR